jgi:hypothetical protein
VLLHHATAAAAIRNTLLHPAAPPPRTCPTHLPAQHMPANLPHAAAERAYHSTNAQLGRGNRDEADTATQSEKTHSPGR